VNLSRSHPESQGVKSFVDSSGVAVVMTVVMARPLRIQYSGAVYHVMNRGGSRQRIFLDKPDYEAFVDVMGGCYTTRAPTR